MRSIISSEAVAAAVARFGSMYGVASDDPPAGWVSREFSWLTNGHEARGTLDLLTRLCDSGEALERFNRCRRLLARIADDAASGRLLDDLLRVLKSASPDPKALTHGILWLDQAWRLDPAHPAGVGMITYGPDLDAGSDAQSHDQAVGSMVLRMYVGLVYMKDGVTTAILTAGRSSNCDTLARIEELLNTDLIRHLRNAIAHGHIGSCVGGLRFRDREFEAIVTPGFVTQVTTWMMAFYHQCLAALSRQDRI